MEEKKFVSRGGLKLEHALNAFSVDVKNLTVLDVGSSTGGFVDCLLQRGAIKIYSLDTAYGELAWKLRQDPRVIVIERQNILRFDSLPEQVDLVTIDVTFTSLTKILPIVQNFIKPNGKIIALVKPQYENQALAMKHKGVIPDGLQKEILDGIVRFANDSGFQVLGQTESPIQGTGGNTEYLVCLSYAAHQT